MSPELVSPERHLCDSKCIPSTECLLNVQIYKWIDGWMKGKKKEEKKERKKKRGKEEIISYQEVLEEVITELPPCLIKQQILTIIILN